MKTLILMRHGHAVEGSADRIRPLTARGQEASRLSARKLLEAGASPQYVVASTAERARHTAELVCEELGHLPLQLRAELYLAEPATVLETIRHLPGDVEHALLVGHNPGFEALASLWCGHRGGLAPAQYAICHWEANQWDAVQRS